MQSERTPTLRRRISLFLVTLGAANAVQATEVCFIKDDFPLPAFEATVRYSVLARNRIRLNVVVDGVGHPYGAILDLYYGVPDDFVWSVSEVYGDNYELMTTISFDAIDEQHETDLHISADFENIALHLSLFPHHPAESVNYCAVDYQAVIRREGLDAGAVRGVAARFERLPREGK